MPELAKPEPPQVKLPLPDVTRTTYGLAMAARWRAGVHPPGSCTECGGAAPRDGRHLCARCEKGAKRGHGL